MLSFAFFIFSLAVFFVSLRRLTRMHICALIIDIWCIVHYELRIMN